MTREEKIQAFAMRLDGWSLQAIGNEYGVSGEAIRQMFAKVTTEACVSRGNYTFQNIRDWMTENKVTQSMFAKELGISQSTVNAYLTGRNNPSCEFIRLVVDKTGMPFEVAFSNERTARKEKA